MQPTCVCKFSPSHKYAATCNRLALVPFQEVKRERAKAAAAIRGLQEKMEEKLRVELEQKVFMSLLCQNITYHMSAFDNWLTQVAGLL